MLEDELLKTIDQLDQEGPAARTAAGERAVDLMEQSADVPGALQAFVDRYSGSSNRATVNGIAFVLGGVADPPKAENVNLIYQFLERTPDWSNGRMSNNALIAIRDQSINDLPWTPAEQTPPVLARFLSHRIEQEADDENDNADTAVNILWNLHLWSEGRGGLPAVFSAEERQAFRDKFDEVGLEPGPVLEALGKD